MKIPFGKKTLNINLNIFWEPQTERLEEDLSDFFKGNSVEGIQIKRFALLKSSPRIYEIIPKSPHFERTLFGGEYEERIRQIGRYYGIQDLRFAHYCYAR